MLKGIRALDLFAGCGGLSLGLQSVGIEVAWANEIDKYAAATYRCSHPGTALFEEDVVELFHRVVSNDDGTPKRGEVDLLVGGPPCQGFSGYNRHRALDDPRNSLVEVFLDYADYLKPRFVLIENVPGMLSLENGKTVNALLAALEEIGYKTRLGVLQAGSYGVPQSRWRVFVWGARFRTDLPSFPTPTHMFPRTTVFGATKYREAIIKPPANEATLFWKPNKTVTVYDAISDLPAIENGGGGEEMEYAGAARTDYQAVVRRGSNTIYDHCTKKLGKLMYQRCRAVPRRPGAGWLDLPARLKPKNLLRHGDDRYPNRFGRLHWEGIFNTILCEAHPYWSSVFHPEQDRVISVRESARAQGFPDALRFLGPQTSRYKQVGNAVPPPLAAALGRQLVEVITNSKKRNCKE